MVQETDWSLAFLVNKRHFCVLCDLENRDNVNKHIEPRHDKTNKVSVRPAKTQMFYFSVSLLIHGGTPFYFGLLLLYISVSTKRNIYWSFLGYGLVCIIVVMPKLKVLNILIILNF